ncbi:hypothetical protein HELRODRAFT_167047 [Helobdella robusta]|uniref:MRG-binding protein n=1 Tax=Helobdella robusta TaxID=6412 RepID=T1EYY0_HELRO|nr:hypothetical protein HELRODRAFT_167047 [Helobdella robusta]ESO10546.1 hypothetical protein HELRODRAFT_167047 [Helobdella robusta]
MVSMNESEFEKQDKLRSVWNVDMQVSLFHAMRDHKPVGVNRHFQMLFIHDKINNTNNPKVANKDVWDYLGTLYDINALVNDSERIPTLSKEVDFELPTTSDNNLKDLINLDFPRLGATMSCLLTSSSSSSLSSSFLADAHNLDSKKFDVESNSSNVDITSTAINNITNPSSTSNSTETNPKTKADSRKRTRQSNPGNNNNSICEVPQAKRNRRI